MTFIKTSVQYEKPKFDIGIGTHGKANKGKPREPLRTFKEMAEELGMKPGALASAMRNSTLETPKPIGHTHNSMNSATYYQPSALRAWWKAECEARTAKP